MRKPYSLPESERERMHRTELNAMIRLIYMRSNMAGFEREFGERLDFIPDGRKRVRLVLGQIKSIEEDLKGTITADQNKRLHNTCRDNEMRLVPRQTPDGAVIALDKHDAHLLFDAAMESRCAACPMDCEECRSCELYKMLVAYIPLDSYETTMCPYAMSYKDWRD